MSICFLTHLIILTSAFNRKACWFAWVASISLASKINGSKVGSNPSNTHSSIFTRSRTILPCWNLSLRSLHTNRVRCPSVCRTRIWNSMVTSHSSPDGEDSAKVNPILIYNWTKLLFSWNSFFYIESPISTRLQYVGVPIINNTECEKIYQTIHKKIDRQSICAGYAEGLKDSCEVSSFLYYTISFSDGFHNLRPVWYTWLIFEIISFYNMFVDTLHYVHITYVWSIIYTGSIL